MQKPTNLTSQQKYEYPKALAEYEAARVKAINYFCPLARQKCQSSCINFQEGEFFPKRNGIGFILEIPYCTNPTISKI